MRFLDLLFMYDEVRMKSLMLDALILLGSLAGVCVVMFWIIYFMEVLYG